MRPLRPALIDGGNFEVGPHGEVMEYGQTANPVPVLSIQCNGVDMGIADDGTGDFFFVAFSSDDVSHPAYAMNVEMLESFIAGLVRMQDYYATAR